MLFRTEVFPGSRHLILLRWLRGKKVYYTLLLEFTSIYRLLLYHKSSPSPLAMTAFKKYKDYTRKCSYKYIITR
jgi:hypothetical protein